MHFVLFCDMIITRNLLRNYFVKEVIMTKHIKKVLTIITSASLTCGTAYAMQPGKSRPKMNNSKISDTRRNFRSNSASKAKINRKLSIGVSALFGAGGLAAAALVIRSKSADKSSSASSSSTSSSSPNTSFSNTSSHNNSFQIQPAHAFKDPNKLNYNVQDKLLHSINLNDFVTVSVHSGCITRVEIDKHNGKSAVMSPDNEDLNPGLLAGAIANDAFGHCYYDDRGKILNDCCHDVENKKKEKKLVTGNAYVGEGKEGKYKIAHVVGPSKNPQDKSTDEQLKLLKSAYYQGIKQSVVGKKYYNVNVCPVSDGKFGFTTTESFSCLKDALKQLKNLLESDDVNWDKNSKISINLVIHPDYNTPSEGGNKSKTDIAINMLNSLQKEIENEKNKENEVIKEVQIVVGEKSK